jgi:hypothetical protein
MVPEHATQTGPTPNVKSNEIENGLIEKYVNVPVAVLSTSVVSLVTTTPGFTALLPAE